MGQISSVLSEALPPRSKFSVDDIPDLTGRIIIVTGGNAGIGKETAKSVLEHNAKVYIAARSEDKTRQTINDLREQTGREAIFLKLDLADLCSVKAAAEEFLSKESKLDVLFNNGGVMAAPIDQVTAQGYDLQFGTNVLGHIYFTKLLLPALLSGANASADGKARVVNTSSSGHHFGKLDFGTFKDGPARRKRFTGFLYTQSKYGNVVFANELARRYGDQGIVSTSLNPGNISTDLYQHVDFVRTIGNKIWMYSPAQGALTQLWAGTSREGIELNGKYLIPWARIGTPHASTADAALGQQLWVWAEDQLENI